MIEQTALDISWLIIDHGITVGEHSDGSAEYFFEPLGITLKHTVNNDWIETDQGEIFSLHCERWAFDFRWGIKKPQTTMVRGDASDMINDLVLMKVMI